jgi:PadR family transcriptional regulator PadR
MLRDFFLGFIKIHILHYAAQEPVYGLAPIQELGRHGYDMGPGMLFPVLHSMQRAGYLVREDRVVAGKVRRYYAITDEGRQALGETREKISPSSCAKSSMARGQAPWKIPTMLLAVASSQADASRRPYYNVIHPHHEEERASQRPTNVIKSATR